MQEWSAIIKTITDKVGEFLNIFDLSFLVSGSTCLSAIYYIYVTFNEPLISISLPICIMLSYILGLICFAIGRWGRKDFIRDRYRRKFENNMKENTQAHKIFTIPEYGMYFKNDGIQFDPLYVRMWADLRETKNYGNSLSIINRYWVMSATYDGLAVACLVWLFALELSWWKNGAHMLSPLMQNINSSIIDNIQIGVAILIVIITVFLVIRSSVEADRYSKHQVREIIATIASWKKTI